MTQYVCAMLIFTINSFLEIDHYPLPPIETIFNVLRGGEFYCELDLKEAYLQTRLNYKSQELTVIVAGSDIYKSLYL